MKERGQSSGTGERVLSGGRLQIRTYTILFDRTGYFTVEVTPQYGETYTHTYRPSVLNSLGAIIGETVLGSGEKRVPILSKSDRVTIDLVNDSHLPCRFQSASWEGEYTLRARRL